MGKPPLPLPGKVLIFAGYNVLCVGHGLLVYSMKGTAYDITVAVLLTECIKLCISVAMYMWQVGGPVMLAGDLYRHARLGLLYLVPSVLYTVRAPQDRDGAATHTLYPAAGQQQSGARQSIQLRPAHVSESR
jgi:hypothetical protein